MPRRAARGAYRKAVPRLLCAGKVLAGGPHGRECRNGQASAGAVGLDGPDMDEAG
jgi:hypothetical protein